MTVQKPASSTNNGAMPEWPGPPDFPMPGGMQPPLDPLPQIEMPPPRARIDYAATLTAAMDIMNARLLALLAVIGAVGMWSYAVWEPMQLRTFAAGGFSATVLLPLVVLYWKKG